MACGTTEYGNLGEMFAATVLDGSPQHVVRADWGYLRNAVDSDGSYETPEVDAMLTDRNRYQNLDTRVGLVLFTVEPVCEFPLPDDQTAAILGGYVRAFREAKVPPDDVVTPLFDEIWRYAHKPKTCCTAEFYTHLADSAFYPLGAPSASVQEVLRKKAEEVGRPLVKRGFLSERKW